MKKRNLKLIALGLTGLMGVAALTGCGSSKEKSATVSTNGSTSMEEVMGALSEQYQKDNEGVKVTYDPTGTEDKCKLEQELTSTGAVISAVGSNEKAIGYASFSAVEGQDKIQGIKINGVTCTEDTIKDGSYKLQRPFCFITKKDGKLSEEAQKFYDFATSKDAADLIRNAGAVPVSE